MRRDHQREEERAREGRNQQVNLLLQTSGSIHRIACVFIRYIHRCTWCDFHAAGRPMVLSDDDVRSLVRVHPFHRPPLSVPTSPEDGPHRKGHLRGYSPISVCSAEHVRTIRTNVSVRQIVNLPELSPSGNYGVSAWSSPSAVLPPLCSITVLSSLTAEVFTGGRATATKFITL